MAVLLKGGETHGRIAARRTCDRAARFVLDGACPRIRFPLAKRLLSLVLLSLLLRANLLRAADELLLSRDLLLAAARLPLCLPVSVLAGDAGGSPSIPWLPALCPAEAGAGLHAGAPYRQARTQSQDHRITLRRRIRDGQAVAAVQGLLQGRFLEPHRPGRVAARGRPS